MDVEYTCPLGSECETAEGKVIKRCAWYTKMIGLDPSTGKEVEDWACSMSWMPMLQVETSKTNRSRVVALESLRNETVKGQEEFNKLVTNSNKLSGEH